MRETDVVLKRDINNRNMKEYSSLIIRKIKIITMMICHLAPRVMALIQKKIPSSAGNLDKRKHMYAADRT